MAPTYRVFTSAPLLPSGSGTSSWITASTRSASPPLPPLTLDKALHNITLTYQNVIFNDDDEEQDASVEWNSSPEGPDATIEWPQTLSEDVSQKRDISNIDDSLGNETYETDLTADNTTMLSEGSSISRFPTFNFSVNMLSSLSSAPQAVQHGAESAKVMLLLGILEIDGPNYVSVKKGVHAGLEVCLLKLIVGDEHGTISKLVAWRETAENWSGVSTSPALKRGDIIFFENILVSRTSRSDPSFDSAKLQLTASPHLKSDAQICYRTLPRTYEDKRYCPDLRLADSVQAVRKVKEAVNWMERMAGISAG